MDCIHQMDLVGKPTTEFMGWRRLTPNDLLNLDVASFFLPSIPPDLCHEDKDTIKLRAALKRNEFPKHKIPHIPQQ
jgi:hypothetical protein